MLSAQLHATETEWRASSPTLWAHIHVRPVLISTLEAGNYKNIRRKKLEFLQHKLNTDLHTILDSGCLVILTIFLFIIGVFTAGKWWYQMALQWHNLAVSRTFTRNPENYDFANIWGRKSVFGDSVDVMGRLKKFILELWSYKYVYKCFYRTKIQMLVKFAKSLKLQFRSYMTVCKNNETFKKIG